MKSGLMLVLHTHLPYVKHQGRRLGESWLLEAMAETYVPLLMAWSRLLADGISAPITLSLSPVLIEQLASDYIQDEFVKYLKEREKMARRDERHFLATGQSSLAQAATDYQRFYQEVRHFFVYDIKGDIAAAFKEMRDGVPLEIITTAATHSYLPLIKDSSRLNQQIEMGKATFIENMGFEPRGFWLPECGYFNGIEKILTDNGFQYFFVDGHAIEGGQPSQIFSGYIGRQAAETFQETGLSTFEPYRVKGQSLLVFGRNAVVSQQVWSKDNGYPGDAAYREYHKQNPVSGMKYWRVTDRDLDQAVKLPYDRILAQKTLRGHASHFVNMVDDILNKADDSGCSDPLLVACYDTELFGHWWWEGVDWLEEVSRQMAVKSDRKMVLPGIVMKERPQLREAQLFESSWGAGGRHQVWSNYETFWMWETLEKATGELKSTEPFSDADWAIRARAQAERELMLMESSDWFFMVANNHTRDYAVKRFLVHYGNLVRLTSLIKSGRFEAADVLWLRRIEKEDGLD